MSKKEQNKPLSFSTTMRNPERIANFLQEISVHEEKILTNEIIEEVAIALIRNKLYVPLVVKKRPEWKAVYDSEEKFDRKTAIEIMEQSPQSHKEAGFDRGWPSRFDTWYKLPMEFGFLYYEMNCPIKISTTGHMLIDAIREDTPNDKKIQKVFLNALMKYQTNNPFRKNANDNVPLPLLLNVIKLLKDDKEENNAGIYRNELSFIICSPDNDAKKIYNQIKNLRKQHRFNYGEEIVYNICLKMLGAGEDQKNRFKMSQITGEAVDEFIRKMRITGIVSLRGNGRFLDFNTFEKDTIEYILQNYTDYKKFASKQEFFEYMGRIDNNILNTSSVTAKQVEDVKQNTLLKWAKDYTFETIAEELRITCSTKESKNDMLRIMGKPTRFEFLTSVILKQQFPELDVRPNYNVDDEGLPVFTATGGVADIECFDSDANSLVEVTLMSSRNQASHEIPAITRHLRDAIQKYPDKFVFATFVVPHVHPDTEYMVGYSKSQYNVDIFACDIEGFISGIKTASTLRLAAGL